MVNEVNKIIYNVLLSGKEICIDGIGTLFTVRYAAYRASRKSVTLPHRIVTFTTDQRGTSLKAEIAAIDGIDEQKANEIFDHWLSESLTEDTLKINGVGTLRRDKFAVDKSFESALNPQGLTPVRLKPKANVGLYIFAALCMAFAVAVAGYVYIDNHGIDIFGKDAPNSEAAEVVAQNQHTEPTTAVTESFEVKKSAEVATPTETVVETTSTAVESTPVQPIAAPHDSGSILPTTVGHNYLVLGVFSTTENAERAIRQAQKRANDLHYSIYYYGNKYMVALYDASSRAECQEFSRSLGDTFKDLWIYTRK